MHIPLHNASLNAHNLSHFAPRITHKYQWIRRFRCCVYRFRKQCLDLDHKHARHVSGHVGLVWEPTLQHNNVLQHNTVQRVWHATQTFHLPSQTLCHVMHMSLHALSLQQALTTLTAFKQSSARSAARALKVHKACLLLGGLRHVVTTSM